MESKAEKHSGIGATLDLTLDSVSRALDLEALPLVLPMRPNSWCRLGIFLGISLLAPKVRGTTFSRKDGRTYVKQWGNQRDRQMSAE